MKRCTTCQNLVNDADGFCPQCGSMSFEPVADMPVEPVQEQMFRPAEPDPYQAPAADPQLYYQPGDLYQPSEFIPEQQPTEPAWGPEPIQEQPMDPYQPPVAEPAEPTQAKPKKEKKAKQPKPQQPAENGEEKKGSKKTLFLILGIAAAVIALGVAAFFLFFNKPTLPTGQSDGTGLGSSPIVFKRIGEVDDESFRVYDKIVSKNSAGEYVLCDPFGTDRLNRTFTSYDIIQKAKGLVIVHVKGNAPNNCGLVSMNTGVVYIPYDAARIDQINERFFAVYYATDETTDVKYAFLGVDSDGYVFKSGLENRTNYNGYCKIYDIVEGEFLPGINFSHVYDSIYRVGDYFGVELYEEKKTTMYDALGQPVKKFPATGAVSFPSEYNIFRQDDTYNIYDKDANLLFSTQDKRIWKVFDGKYYSVREDDGYYLYRADGTRLFDQKSDYDFDMIGSSFVFYKKNLTDFYYGLIDQEGNVIIEPKADYISENQPATGFTWVRFDDNNYSMLFPDGFVLNLKEYNSNGCIYEKTKDGEYKVFIFSDEDYRTISCRYASPLTKFIMEIQDENGKYGLLDTFSGEMLLPCEYERIDYGYENECVYAQAADGTWDIFAIHENDYLAAEKVKRTVLTALDEAFKKEGISAVVDLTTGEVALDNTVLFALDKADLSPEGKAFLQKFMRAYTSVVFDKRYEGYIDSILIEGHTDTDGTREHNMELSQNRANNVMNYCLSAECGDNADVADKFSAVGIADDRPVMNADGTVDMEGSRRVTFTLLIMTQELTGEEENK